MTSVDRIPLAHSVVYAVRGVPEVPDEYNAGRTIAPHEITLTYRTTEDSQLGRIYAVVKGWWMQDGQRVPMDKPVGRHFWGRNFADWPEWLAKEARLHDPDATAEPPVDQTAALQQDVARLGRMVDEYGTGASALTDKLKRVRDLHRETCILARGDVQPTAYRCGMCEVLDAPAAPTAVEPPADRAAEPACKDAEGCHRVVPCAPGCGTRDLLAEATRPLPETADRAALRDRIAGLFRHPPGQERLGDATPGEIADAVLAVLPPPVSRADVYRDAADVAFVLDFDELRATTHFDSHRQAWELGTIDVANKLRRMADEAQPDDTVHTCPGRWGGPDCRCFDDEAQPTQADRIVAYRSPGTRTLYCVICARQETGWQTVTAATVRDDTECDFCGGQVLAVASQTLGQVIARHISDQPAPEQS